MQGLAAGGTTLRQRLCALALAAALPVALASCSSGLNGMSYRLGQPLANQGDSPAGAFLAGRFAQSQNDPTVAAHYLLEALAADPENVELLQRSLQALADDGKLAEAETVARQLLRFDPDAALAALLVAEQDARDGHWSEARDQVAKLPRRGLNAVMVPLITAWSYMGEDRVDEALAALEPLRRSAAYEPLRLFHSALINDLADRRAAASRDYQALSGNTMRLALRSVEAATAFYRRTGQADKAQDLLRRYALDHPETAAILSDTQRGRVVNSAKAGLAEAYFSGAVTLRQSEANDLALIFGHMALALQPDLPSCQAMVADLLQDMGRLGEANAIFAKIQPTAAAYPTARLRIALNLDSMGDTDGAVAELKRLAQIPAVKLDALSTLGDILRSHHRWIEAASAYSQAIALFPAPERNQWSFYYSRGIAYERAGQWPLAEADLLKALDLMPDEPHVLNYLGYSWIDKGMHLERAQRMIEKAVEQLPNDGDIVDSLGWAYYRTGHYAKAVATLQKAVELHPEEATINHHLGDALWATGRHEEARYQWQRALVFKPDADEKAVLEQELAHGGTLPAPLKAGKTDD
ncbi:beta-barrel assembly-enhancing protease [mine drainage metagenome]|uniref:Beta-barrel assembly-enhancing protease n=1 Tax=mine drainage metagenome TaxID=410659 RepID=A0A1J5S9E1_9ZZZZ